MDTKNGARRSPIVAARYGSLIGGLTDAIEMIINAFPERLR